MNYNNLKLNMKSEYIYIPRIGTGDKNLCISFLGENCNFLEAFDKSNIRAKDVPFVFVPTISYGKNIIMSPSYRNEIKLRKMRPLKGSPENISVISNRNFFYDTSVFFNFLLTKFKIQHFGTNTATKIYDMFFSMLNNVNKKEFENVLLYSIDLSRPFSNKIQGKKIFPILNRIIDSGGLPIVFDKIILFTYSEVQGNVFRLIWDIENNNTSKLRAILNTIKYDSEFVNNLNNVVEGNTIDKRKTSFILEEDNTDSILEDIKNKNWSN